MKAMKKDTEYPVHKLNTCGKTPLVRIPSLNTKKYRAIPVRESLSWFSSKMEEDLQVSDGFMSAWETEFAMAILDDLNEQVSELSLRFFMAMRCSQPEIHNTVINHCVHVANLAHMIASSQDPMLSRCRKGKSVR